MENKTKVDFSTIKTYPLSQRKSKITQEMFAHPMEKGGTFSDFFHGLPDILASKDIKEIAKIVAESHKNKKLILLGMGAHPIKVGLSPFIIQLMEAGVLRGIAMNGAGIIHDFEISMVGHTSEDVAEELTKGSFGFAEETGKMINSAINEGVKKGSGIGEAVGDMIIQTNFPYKEKSILVTARTLGIPVTIHVALGTDIIHLHPYADGALIGEGSMRDFKTFTSLVSNLNNGVYINLGSAVILPEIFLKALALVKNLGYDVEKITTVNIDFVRQYRSITNVVTRPTSAGGKGYNLIGHHELIFSLLATAILEMI